MVNKPYNNNSAFRVHLTTDKSGLTYLKPRILKINQNDCYYIG